MIIHRKGVLTEHGIDAVDDREFDLEVERAHTVAVVSITEKGDVVAQFYLPPSQVLLDAIDRARAACVEAMNEQRQRPS